MTTAEGSMAYSKMSNDDPTHAHCRRMIEQGVPGHAQAQYRDQLPSYFCYNSGLATFYIVGSTLTRLKPVRDAVNGTAKTTPSAFRRDHLRKWRDEKDTDRRQYEKHEAVYRAHRHEMI